MLAEDLVDRPDQAVLCEKIDRAVLGLDGIVRDVLLFAREMKIKPTRTQAAELMTRALAGCESLIVGADVQVRWRPPSDDALRFHADEGLLVQALGNVIRNAIEAMVEQAGSNRAIECRIARRPVRCPDGNRRDRTVFSIRDEGPGIPDEVIERMFNPFFTTRATGTGLGLAIVHRIVDAHGGHVAVTNSDGGGAVVELCLPAQPPSNGRTRPKAFPDDTQDAMQMAGDVRRRIIKEDES
jgi:two-component system sensor histidine kinase HydH